MKEARYSILKKLAEGGSGETYLVWDKRLEQNWVMKRIRVSRQAQWEAAEREIAALRQIHKEGIPVLTDVFYEKDAVCIVMEYMTGVSLEERIKTQGAMEEQEALTCALQTAKLIRYLHRLPQKLIHGDIKPLNLICHNGTMALLDFGGTVAAVSRAKNSREMERMAAVSPAESTDAVSWYTPGYGAPELLTGSRVSEKSDIYAFGAVLFYMVTGQGPEESRGIYPVREQNVSLSGGLERIILKCTEKEPEKRYGMVEEIIEDLEKLSAVSGQGKHRDRKKQKKPVFHCRKNILLTEGRLGSWLQGTGTVHDYRYVRAALLLAAGICSFTGHMPDGNLLFHEERLQQLTGMPGTVMASGQPLPVSIRNKAGEKLLVDFTAIYHTKENPIFELPVSCFETGKEYEVTISQQEKKSGLRRDRTFVICAD